MFGCLHCWCSNVGCHIVHFSGTESWILNGKFISTHPARISRFSRFRVENLKRHNKREKNCYMRHKLNFYYNEVLAVFFLLPDVFSQFPSPLQCFNNGMQQRQLHDRRRHAGVGFHWISIVSWWLQLWRRLEICFQYDLTILRLSDCISKRIAWKSLWIFNYEVMVMCYRVMKFLLKWKLCGYVQA